MKKQIAGITAAILIAVCLFVTGGMQMVVPEGVIVKFSYGKVKDELKPIVGKSMSESVPIDSAPLVEQLVKAGHTEGVILVVKVGTSKNVLRSMYSEKYNLKGEKRPEPMDLDPNKQYLMEEVSLGTASHVETQVEVLDVLFQTEGAHFKAGQQVAISEPYYIVDQRITDAEKYYGSDSAKETMDGYIIKGKNGREYFPFEKDEIYVVLGYWGHFTHYSDKQNERMDLIYGEDTIRKINAYCLTNYRKPSGYISDTKTLARNIEYIRANYDLDKYLK